MNLPRLALLALGIVLLSAPGGASAQEDKYKPLDLKPLVPPVFQLPPGSRLNPGAVGGALTPYSTTPLQSPSQSRTQSAPGIKLTIPSRGDADQ